MHHTHSVCEQCSAGRVFQYWVGSGRVLDIILGSGSGSGRVGMSKNTIRYWKKYWVAGRVRVGFGSGRSVIV